MIACHVCGRDMKPLFTGFYCPNDCDRKGNGVPVELDDIDTNPITKDGCPKCGSADTAPFALTVFSITGSKHCIDCGHVWTPGAVQGTFWIP